MVLSKIVIFRSLLPTKESLVWRLPQKGENDLIYRVYAKNGLNFPISILKAAVEQNEAFSLIEVKNSEKEVPIFA